MSYLHNKIKQKAVKLHFIFMQKRFQSK